MVLENLKLLLEDGRITEDNGLFVPCGDR